MPKKADAGAKGKGKEGGKAGGKTKKVATKVR